MSSVAVVFDLFGTLVPAFRRHEHTVAMHACAVELGVAEDACHQAWVDSFPARIQGDFDSVADNFRWIAARQGVAVGDDAVTAATERYLEFTRSGLVPFTGVAAALATLRRQGLLLGLVTNCAPDVPTVLPATPLGPLFDAAVYSCRDRMVKPDPRTYRLILDRLGVAASETVYVGDGSDEELGGALGCRMTAVLVAANLSDTYDQHRPEVLAWSGPRVRSVADIPGWLARPA